MLPWAKIFHPSLLARQWIRKQPDWSLQTKLDLDWFPYPQYAYALNQAAIQAKRLGIDRISAIELGVGDGSGLAALEAIADELTKERDVVIDVYGIEVQDREQPATDARDQPYAPASRVPIDRSALNGKLRRTTLIIGDLAETVPTFFDVHQPAPLGFVSFNLCWYTRSRQALGLFDFASDSRLPRTFASFENVIGSDDALHCEHAGELLAIAEFNSSNPNKKLGLIHGLRHKRVFPSSWNDHLHVLHDFEHPRYGDPAA